MEYHCAGIEFVFAHTLKVPKLNFPSFFSPLQLSSGNPIYDKYYRQVCVLGCGCIGRCIHDIILFVSDVFIKNNLLNCFVLSLLSFFKLEIKKYIIYK